MIERRSKAHATGDRVSGHLSRFLVMLGFAASLLAGFSPMVGAREPVRPRPGVARNAWDEDIAAKRALDRDGAVRAGRDVVLWFPKDSLTDEQAARIVARLDRGIRAAKLRIGKPEWAIEGDRRVHFYCPAPHFTSHAPGEPLDRVKSEWLASIGFTLHGEVGAGLPPQRSMDDMHGDCAHFSWDLSREMELWQRPEILVRAGSIHERVPGVHLDDRVVVTLAPHRQVRLFVTPGKAPGTDSTFSGFVVFTPPADGVYRVSAGHPVWIDAIVSGKTVPSERFEMQTGCRTIFKSIAFTFRAREPVVLQLSGSTLDTVALMVTRWSD